MGLDKVRTEGYLLSSPGGVSLGISETPFVPMVRICPALQALLRPLPCQRPQGRSLFSFHLRHSPPPTAPEVPQEGNRKRKARELDLLNEYVAEEPHESEGIQLSASQARPRGTAEPPIHPSSESFPPSQSSRAGLDDLNDDLGGNNIPSERPTGVRMLPPLGTCFPSQALARVKRCVVTSGPAVLHRDVPEEGDAELEAAKERVRGRGYSGQRGMGLGFDPRGRSRVPPRTPCACGP